MSISADSLTIAHLVETGIPVKRVLYMDGNFQLFTKDCAFYRGPYGNIDDFIIIVLSEDKSKIVQTIFSHGVTSIYWA